MIETAKIGVLVSGKSKGSNFRAIVQAHERSDSSVAVGVLIATDETHGAVEFAREHNVHLQVLAPGEFASNDEWEARAIEILHSHHVSLVALAGFMRRVGTRLLNEFPQRIVNIHPSLLPSFGGAGMFGRRVHQAVIEHGCKVSGCTVHLIDERFDNGPIVAQRCVTVEENDTAETLASRVQVAENELYPHCLELLARGNWRVEGRRVVGLGEIKN